MCRKIKKVAKKEEVKEINNDVEDDELAKFLKIKPDNLDILISIVK